METKRKTDTAEPKVLTEWEWTTLIAAWRYYQYGATAASATFPAEIVRRFFSRRGEWSERTLLEIAHQFAVVDHGLSGEDDWNCASPDDARAWCKFFAFCRAWAGDCFGRRTLRGREYRVFRCIRTGRTYPLDQYLANPAAEVYIDEADAEEAGR